MKNQKRYINIEFLYPILGYSVLQSTAFDKKTELIKKELQQQQKLQNEMKKNRKKQLLSANEIEDRNIKKLGKQLKLNKRNSKSIPQSFSADGLDCILSL